MRTFLSTVVVLALVGCGGDDETGATGGPSATSSTGTATAATGAGGSGAGGAGAGGDASGPSTSSGGGGEVLFPLNDGVTRVFKVTKIGAGGACGEGIFNSKIKLGAMLDGKQSFAISPWCDAANADGIYAAGAGDELLYRYGNAWQVILDGKVVDGQKWKFQGLEYQWKMLGKQTVAGKDYDDCWSAARTDAAKVYDVYCRGVGDVLHHNEVGGNGFEAALQ